MSFGGIDVRNSKVMPVHLLRTQVDGCPLITSVLPGAALPRPRRWPRACGERGACEADCAEKSRPEFKWTERHGMTQNSLASVLI